MTQQHDVTGIRMRWEERGTGIPVVFIRGIPAGPALWRHVIPRVKRGHDDAHVATESLDVHWQDYTGHHAGEAMIRQMRALDMRDTLAAALQSLIDEVSARGNS